MKKLNKKSIMFFNMFLVFIAVAILVLALLTILEKVKNFDEKEIGEREANLLNEYRKGEKAMMYIDTAAKFSAYQSIYDLAANGGYNNKPDCGEYGIYALWTTKDKACYPDEESIKLNLSSFLNKNLNPYLSNYKDIFIPENNYAFAFNEKLKIIGIALQNIYTSRSYSESTNKPRGFAWPTSDDKPYVEECFGYDSTRKENIDHIEVVLRKDSDVFAVLTGKVEKVTADSVLVDNAGNKIKVEYRNLKTINVNEGNEIKTQDLIGKANTDILKLDILALAVIDEDATASMKIGNYVNPLNYFSHPLLKNGKYGDVTFNKDSLTCKAIENKVTYAIKPSFDLAIDYSLDDYSLIKENVKDLIAKCSKEDLNTCANNEIKKFDSKTFSWSADCGTEEEKVFSEFLSYYQRCLASEMTDCSCEFKLKDGPKNKEFKIRMANDGNKITATLNKFSETIDAIGPTIAIEDSNKQLVFDLQKYIDFIIKYDGDGKAAIRLKSEAYSGDLGFFGVVFLNKRYDFNLDMLKMYKRSELVSFSENKIGSSCSVSERQANFCVTNNEKKFLVYDKIADKVEEKNIVYSFAIDFGDTTPPPPIKNLEAIDQPKAQNSLILTWDKIDEKEANDIKYFNIYYTKNNIKETKIENHNLKDERGDNVDKKEKIDATEYEEISDIDLENCNYVKEGEPCVYDKYNKALEKGKLHLWGEEFIYILSGLDDGEKYNLAVAAVDFSDNEIDGVSAGQELETAQGNVADDLAPGRVMMNTPIYDSATKKLTLSWLAVDKNYDGTNINDFNKYEIYKFTALKTAIEPADLPIAALSDLSYPLDNLAAGTYYFAVIATDETPNKISDLNDKNLKTITIS
ncbi:MAG: hypothetical protein Q7J54_01445 [Candidatus Woesearchaeota archaeon]|nr:hypothetical protein [Candidatus Woesearchaeota archaeon]